MRLLTKVAKGVAFGDVSNQAVRNILTELSKKLYGGITEQEMYDTMENEFGWRCPYTDRDLKASVLAKDGTYATDHIYPQNRIYCGLNVKGNLIIVDKKANLKKDKMDVKTFMETDSEFWTNLGVDKPTRMARLKKIQDFQKKCGYDPDQVQTVVTSLMQEHYDAVRAEQERMIDKSLNELSKSGIVTRLATPTPESTALAVTAKSKKSGKIPELIFTPADEKQFKNELLKRKKAHFELTYASGKKVTSPWNASFLSFDSNLRGNIQSRPFWRNRVKEELVKVEVFID
jgi:hypothetical protein